MFYSALKSKVDRLNRELASKDNQLKSAEMKLLNSNELHSEQVRKVNNNQFEYTGMTIFYARSSSITFINTV